MDLRAKAAAFCRELADRSLAEIAEKNGMQSTLTRATELIKSGQVGPELDAALDSLDQMMRSTPPRVGLYPPVVRGYQPLPDPVKQTSAQWWTCPRDQCAGRGRVLPDQPVPVCLAVNEPLVPGQFPG